MAIGPILDETQDPNVINNAACAKARQVILLKWLVLGFCLTACYKSVLLSHIVVVGYEKAIDTVDDMLLSGKPFAVAQNTDVPSKIRESPRASVRKLADQFVLFNLSSGPEPIPQWVNDGLVRKEYLSSTQFYTQLFFQSAE